MPAQAQSLANLFGKIIRINPDGTIPEDNPFFATATDHNRAIWALGLRNPFTFEFQPGTGRMFINDVGQDTWEEINEGVAGANYGWPLSEGPTTDPRFKAPIFSYPNGSSDLNSGCAVASGTFYNPLSATFPEAFVGKYLFGDLCSGWIRVLDPATHQAEIFATAFGTMVDLNVSPDGDLYVLGNNGPNPGPLTRIRFEGPAGSGGQAVTSRRETRTIMTVAATPA